MTTAEDVHVRPWSAAHNMRLPAWSLALFTLWDFYYAGVRPFDQLGIFFLIGAIALQSGRAWEMERGLKFLLLILAALWVIFLGSLQHADAWSPAAGMTEGVVAATLISVSHWREGEFVPVLKAFILIHGGAELLQLAVYGATHYLLNYQAWLGADLRTYAGGMGIRATGLFQEPAEVSLMMLSLLTLFRITGGKSWWLESFGIACMMVSLSLWGWAASFFFVVVFRPRLALLTLPFVLAAIIYVFSEIDFNDPQAGLVANLIVRRVMDPSHDTSAQARYGALMQSIDFYSAKVWFGQGVTNEYQQYGANGLSFILSCGGILGSSLFVSLWAFILPRGRKLQGLLTLGFMLSGASQWTFVWWWVWLAVAATKSANKVTAMPEVAHI